jgi:hypothetical protein
MHSTSSICKEMCDSAMKLHEINTTATTYFRGIRCREFLLEIYTNELTSLLPTSATNAQLLKHYQKVKP